MDEDNSCPQCGSTQLEVDEDDGRTYCENGHDQGRAPVVAEDDQDFARQGKVLKKKEAKEKQKASGVLHGARAYQLFLQSWQLILRKQCYALVYQKGLPPELWTIVRDLWVLWLSKLDHRLRDATESQPRTGTGTGSASEADPATTSADETDTDPETEEGRRARQERDSTRVGPALVDTVVLNYLGILLLRRPIGLATLLKWIQQEDIPFIRAVRHVPAEMKDRLPGEYRLSLDSTRILEPDDLQAAVYRRAKMYTMSFGMTMPPLNHKLLFLGYVRSLALPIEVYSIAQRLNTIISYPFCYPDPTTWPSTRHRPTTYPETQMMSLIVVATKLLFPFDSQTVKRYPKDPNDPTSLRMNWAAWLDAKRRFDDPKTDSTDGIHDGPAGLDPGSEIHVTDSDILKMTDRQLDQYMDWYQRTWTAKPDQQTWSRKHALDKEILDLFPLHDLPERIKSREEHERTVAEDQARVTARIKEVQASLASRKAIPPEEEDEQGMEVLRPGTMYPQIRHVEDLDHADGWVKVFHEEAALTACTSVKRLLRAVNHCEETIEQWLRARRREEVFRDDNENEDDGEEELLSVDQQEEEDRHLASDLEDAAGPRMPVLATSPPAASASRTLARDLKGLEIESSPMLNESSSNEGMGMGMGMGVGVDMEMEM
ncbi:hypothetical protein A1O3_06458 [Capronia epimyces CBS 606.96]|uniref:RRN7-type domain-containing protein n=1 Tax=Capronia epimyces CBS 606.96 TaxID=1182542 RepID=W9XZ39_9EURO|nr:uncharacterized protein A1O3_06458 [Capronia epimyces CBS 606.96]EXJ82645.1 hypothetical protein A1O3_06458 [Capronia epimyces CBS 606.96]